LKRFDGAGAFDFYGGNLIASDNASDDRFRENRNAMVGVQLLGKSATRAHFPAAMDKCDSRTNLGQQQSIFRRGVAAANDADVFALDYNPIAGSAFYQTPSSELFLSGNAEPSTP
jgi:hypothetical protein